MPSIRRLLLALTLPLALAGCGGGLVVGLDLGYGGVYYETDLSDNDNPPSVSIAASASSARVGDAVRLIAAASDDYGVRVVEFFRVDENRATLLASVSAPPYQIDTVVPATNASAVFYMARAVDDAGHYRDSTFVTVTIQR
jgi:Bacterial Ig domain